jgi:hypothetical protein
VLFVWTNAAFTTNNKHYPSWGLLGCDIM